MAGHHAFLVNIPHAAFRLEKHMLLGWREVFRLHDHICVFKPLIHITRADFTMGEHIVAEVIMEDRRVRLHGFDRIIKYGQHLIIHIDQIKRLRGNLFAFGNH